MKPRIIYLALVVVLLFPDAPAQWIQTNGSFGEMVTSFAVVPAAGGAAGNNIFAATRGSGVFLSTDDGTNWTAVNNGFGTLSVYALAAIPDSGGTGNTNLFAGTRYGCVYLSTDNGSNWRLAQGGMANIGGSKDISYISTLAVSPASGNRGGRNLFAGTYERGLYLTTNNGTSWTAVNTGLTILNITALGVVPAGANTDSTILFAGSASKVFRSTNDGASWAVTPEFTNQGVEAFAVSPADGETGAANLFAGSRAGVFLSTNNGTSWKSVSAGLPQYSVCSMSTSGANLFAGTYSSGVYLSTDRGETWWPANHGLGTASIYALAVSGEYLFAGTIDGGIWRRSVADMIAEISPPSGVPVWVRSSGLDSPGMSILSLAVSGPNLIAGTNTGGIFVSTNKGATWPPSSATQGDILCMAVSGSYVFAGTPSGTGILRSSDYGANWIYLEPGSPSITALCVQGTDLFAGSTGVYRSADSGMTFAPVNNGVLNPHVQSFAATDGSLFAGMLYGLDWSGLAYNGGVCVSTDRGATWSARNTGLTDTDVRVLAAFDTTLLAATYKSLFRSTNHGATWSESRAGLINPKWSTLSVHAFAASGEKIFAGVSGGGVFASVDDGTSWVPINYGLANKDVYSLAVCDSFLIAGTVWGGLWRLPLWDLVLSVDEPPREVPQCPGLDQNYPNPFNPSTAIGYTIAGTGHEALGTRWVKLAVYDLLGREVAVLVNEKKASGHYEVRFDGAGLSSGVYFCRLEVRPLDSAVGRDSKSGAGDFIQTRKLLLLK
jgi:photosystem II stability/assembly factor-like uncharacterized protein